MATKSRKDVSPEDREVGLRLQEALDLNGMTHRELGEKIGKSTRTIEGYVAGEFSPKQSVLEIERVLSVPVKYLLQGTGPSTVNGDSGETRYITYGEFRTWRAAMDAQIADLKKQVERLTDGHSTQASPPQA